MRWTLRIDDVVHGTPSTGKREDAVLPFVLFAAASEKSALAVAAVAAYVGWGQVHPGDSAFRADVQGALNNQNYQSNRGLR